MHNAKKKEFSSSKIRLLKWCITFSYSHNTTFTYFVSNILFTLDHCDVQMGI